MNGWLAVILLAGVLFGVAGADSDMVMTLTFTATSPTEAGALHELSTILAGVATTHADLGPVVGEPSVHNQTGWYHATGSVTLQGSPHDLLVAEQQYALADIRVEDGFLSEYSTSVRDLENRATKFATMAVVAVALVGGFGVFSVVVGHRKAGVAVACLVMPIVVFYVTAHLYYARFVQP